MWEINLTSRQAYLINICMLMGGPMNILVGPLIRIYRLGGPDFDA